MDAIWPYLPFFLGGLKYTVGIALGGLAVALLVGAAVGTAAAPARGVLPDSRLTRIARSVCVAYVEFFRGTSEVVQLYWVFFALPLLISVSIPPVVAAIGVLGLNQGAFVAEIVRGSLNAVDKGQREACVALNIPRYHRLRRVLWPQAVASMLPGLGNSAVDLVKATSIVSLITVSDLTYRTMSIRQSTGNSVNIFVLSMLVYLVITTVITLAFRWFETLVPAGLRSTRARAGVS